MQLLLENGSRLIHETLRIEEKVAKARRLLENAHQGRAGQLGFILQVCEHVWDGAACVRGVLPRGAHRLGRDTALARQKR